MVEGFVSLSKNEVDLSFPLPVKTPRSKYFQVQVEAIPIQEEQVI